MRIGIFDSGIGGVNVLSCLLNKYPNNEYLFYGDTKNLPYGNKSKEELMTLACQAIDFLLTKNVDIIIIACGTISSTCFKDLKKKYSIPIYDIISPTLKYIKENNLDNIGVIGTNKTIESNIFNLENKKILMKATPSFVPIIENGEIDIKKDNILKELAIFKKYDYLVLGCTHYPSIKKIIDDNMSIKTIDMGKCLCNELEISNNSKKSIELYFTMISVNLIINVDKIIIDEHQIYAI